MRFIEDEIAGMGHKRYAFAIGKYEAEILLCLLIKALKYMPKTIMTSSTEMRMKNMRNELAKSIPRINRETENDPRDEFSNFFAEKEHD